MAATLTQQQQPSQDFDCNSNSIFNFTNPGVGALVVLTFGVCNQQATRTQIEPTIQKNLGPGGTKETEIGLKNILATRKRKHWQIFSIIPGMHSRGQNKV